MHISLEKLVRMYPMLLPAIARGVDMAYARLCDELKKDRLKDVLFTSAFLKLLEPHVNYVVREEVNLLGLPGVTTQTVRNKGGHYHTEIHVAEMVITVSNVASPNNCPREAVYRKNLASGQISMDELLGIQDSLDSTVYVIVTHFRRDGEYTPECIKAGVPDENGTAWASAPITIGIDTTEETLVAQNHPDVSEETIERTAKPKRKA